MVVVVPCDGFVVITFLSCFMSTLLPYSPFSKDEVNGIIYITSDDVLAYLTHIADYNHRAELRRPCNQKPISKEETLSTFQISFQNKHILHINEIIGLKPYTVQLTESLFSKTGLGYRIFPSSIILSQFLISFSNHISHRKVLELGSGLGLSGIITCQLQAKRIVLTDYNENLLQSLMLNVNENCYSKYKERVLSVKFLDWNPHNIYSCYNKSNVGISYYNDPRTHFDRSTLSLHSNSCKIKSHHIPIHSHSDVVKAPSTCSGSKSFDFSIIGNELFDIIIGADLLYEKESSDWIPLVMKKHVNILALSRRGRLPSTHTAVPCSVHARICSDCFTQHKTNNGINSISNKSSNTSGDSSGRDGMTTDPSPVDYAECSCAVIGIFVAPTRDLSILNCFINNVRNLSTACIHIDIYSATETNWLTKSASQTASALTADSVFRSNLCKKDMNGVLYIDAVEGEDCVIMLIKYNSR